MGKIESAAAILFAGMIVGVQSYGGSSSIWWVDHDGLIHKRLIIHSPDGPRWAVPFMRGGDIYILTDIGSVFVYDSDNTYKIMDDGSRVMIDPRACDVRHMLSSYWTKKIDEDTIFYTIDDRSLPYMATFTGDSCICVALSKVRGEHWHDGNMLFTVWPPASGHWVHTRGQHTTEVDLSGHSLLDMRYGKILCNGTNRGPIRPYVIDIQTGQKIWELTIPTREVHLSSAKFASDNVILISAYEFSNDTNVYLCVNMVDNTVYRLCW